MIEHHLSNSIAAFALGLGFFWMMAILLRDFGGGVIALFLSGIGNLILAVMVLIDIRETWKPLALIVIGGAVGKLLFVIGL